MTKPASHGKLHISLEKVPDGSGDCLLPIPDELLKSLNWNIGDSIDVDVLPNGSIMLSNANGSMKISKPTQIDTEIFTAAAETFGDPQKAERWLQAHNLILGMSPAKYLENGGDKGDILRILHSISYGGVA
jgi:antitoxin component of MazEF toxin-antitoxin module